MVLSICWINDRSRQGLFCFYFLISKLSTWEQGTSSTPLIEVDRISPVLCLFFGFWEPVPFGILFRRISQIWFLENCFCMLVKQHTQRIVTQPDIQSLQLWARFVFGKVEYKFSQSISASFGRCLINGHKHAGNVAQGEEGIKEWKPKVTCPNPRLCTKFSYSRNGTWASFRAVG